MLNSTEKCRNCWATSIFRVPEFLKPLPEIRGIMYGDYDRLLYTLITTYERQSRYVHWLFDTGSPLTFLSYEVRTSS